MMDKKETVRKGYDSCADRYYETRNQLFSEDRFHDFIEKLPEEGRILDVGCGAGVPVTKYLADRGYRMIGVDLSREMLKRAKENVPSGDFLQQDMTSLDFDEDGFDGLTAFYSIIHVPRGEHRGLLSDINDILRTSGVMLISLGSTGWEGTNDDFLGAEMYWSHHSPEKTLQMVEDVGFEIIDDCFTQHHWNDQEEEHYWILARNGK